MNRNKKTARKRRALLNKGILEGQTRLGRWARRIWLQGKFTSTEIKAIREASDAEVAASAQKVIEKHRASFERLAKS